MNEIHVCINLIMRIAEHQYHNLMDAPPINGEIMKACICLLT